MALVCDVVGLVLCGWWELSSCDCASATLITMAFWTGLVVVLKGETTLPWWAYIISLLLGGMPIFFGPTCPLIMS